MKIRSDINTISIVFTRAEARVFLDELLDVPRGSRKSKLRQVCLDLELGLRLKTMLEEKGRKSNGGT